MEEYIESGNRSCPESVKAIPEDICHGSETSAVLPKRRRRNHQAARFHPVAMWCGAVVVAVVLLAWPRAGFAASPSGSAQEVSTAPAAERFELAHDGLHDVADGYGSDVLKTIASLILVMGWLMVSAAARNFLRDSSTARRTALIVMPVLAMADTVWLWDRFVTSRALADLLDTLGYVPIAYYADARITGTLWITNLVVHLTLFSTLFALIYSQQPAGIGGVSRPS